MHEAATHICNVVDLVVILVAWLLVGVLATAILGLLVAFANWLLDHIDK